MGVLNKCSLIAVITLLLTTYLKFGQQSQGTPVLKDFLFLDEPLSFSTKVRGSAPWSKPLATIGPPLMQLYS